MYLSDNNNSAVAKLSLLVRTLARYIYRLLFDIVLFPAGERGEQVETTEY